MNNPADTLAALAADIERAGQAAPLVLGNAAFAISPSEIDGWVSRLRALASLKGEAVEVSGPPGERQFRFAAPPAPQAVGEVTEARVEAALAVLGLRADRKDDVRAALRVAHPTPSPAQQGGGEALSVDAIRRSIQDAMLTGTGVLRIEHVPIASVSFATPPAQQPGEGGVTELMVQWARDYLLESGVKVSEFDVRCAIENALRAAALAPKEKGNG